MQDLQLTVDTQSIIEGIEAFEQKKIQLTELADGAKDLRIESVEDRQGLKLVSEKRKELKAARVEIQKQGKSMRDTLTIVSRSISSKEKELIEVIEPVEKQLQEEENRIEAEKERLRLEEIEREEKRIQLRIDSLAEFGYQIDYADIKSMTDETFTKYLEAAKVQFEKEQADKIEAERLRIEQEEKEKQEREAEQKRIQGERAELERLRKEQQEREEKLQAEQKALQDEKDRIEREKREEQEKVKRAEEIKQAQERAAEQARLKAIEDQKESERLRLEKEQKEKELSERKAARQPDKVKIQSYIDAIKSIPVPELKTQDAKTVMSAIQEWIGKFNDYGNKKVSEL